MMLSVATFIVSALTASVAGIIAPPTMPRAIGEVIMLQPPQHHVPKDTFITYECEVGLQRVGHHNIRGIKSFHPITDIIREAIVIPSHISPGRYNLIVTDHRTIFDKDTLDNQALPSYRTQTLNVTITVAHADPYKSEFNKEL